VARWTAPATEGAGVGPKVAAVTGLYASPRVLIDDGQLGLLGGDPLALRALLADPPARVRVLHPPSAVPDLLADVNRVGEDADAAAAVAVDRGAGPGLAASRGDVLGIEARGDRARTVPVDELLVDPADDGGLFVVDHPLAGACDAVAVGLAAGAGAPERASGEAAVGLSAKSSR